MSSRLSLFLRLGAASVPCCVGGDRAMRRDARRRSRSVAPSGDLRSADQAIDAMIRDRALVVRDVQRDTLLPDRVHERLDQYVRGVRVVGGDLTRQTAADGTVSVFGTLHTDLALDLTPAPV